ncbi:MAG: hypothetical protein CM15mP125_1540 [Gammaproteobacteria bacterium]|nr:MAG: hypothetical protein CM15mP125_1540 [Gammaproteobacteria bacterium]
MTAWVHCAGRRPASARWREWPRYDPETPAFMRLDVGGLTGAQRRCPRPR